MNAALIQVIIGVLFVLIIVFLVLREFNCWYWKINQRITLQKETNLLLEKILQKSVKYPSNKIIEDTVNPNTNLQN